MKNQDAEPLDPAELERSGFHRIFNGQSLQDWDGDPTYWNVKDGTLIGTVTPETLLKKNSWIVYRGELVEDFELVLEYRVSAGGNSGVGYRLAVLSNDPFSVRGPQADIHGADMFTGICYEENGRRLLAARGQITRLERDNLPRLVVQLADPEELQSVVRKEDWNRYRLIVKGHQAQHFINGVLMSEVHDYDEANRMRRGLIGVQVHVGPPMTIEYRHLLLKHLSEKPSGNAGREHVVYEPGSLSEPAHAATFNHLAAQAAQMTAAPNDKPLDGMTDLQIVTKNLGLVRSDLNNVKLHGGVKPLPSQPVKFDFVVDQIIRVPHTGKQPSDLSMAGEYLVKLRWDAAAKHYRLVELTATGQTNDN